MGKSTIPRAIFNRYVCLPEGNQRIDKYLAFRQSLEILRFEKNDHVIIQQNGSKWWVYKKRPKPVLPKPGIRVYVREIIPFYGPRIQVSEPL